LLPHWFDAPHIAADEIPDAALAGGSAPALDEQHGVRSFGTNC